MDTLFRDLRIAVRSLFRRPGFAIAVILTLGLGVAATTTVSAIVYGVLLKPLPYPDAERIVSLWFVGSELLGPGETRQSQLTFLHYRNENRRFASIALAEPLDATLTLNDEPRRANSAVVTSEIFDVLSIAPMLGRPIQMADTRPGAEPTMMVSHAFWEGELGRAEDVVGRTLSVDGITRRVVGVLPREVRFPEEGTEFWLPLTIDEASPETLRFTYRAYGRMLPGVTHKEALQNLNHLIDIFPDTYPTVAPRQVLERLQIRARMHPLRDDIVGSVSSILWIILGSTSLLLLITTMNVANLLLVRTEARHREIVIRTALGAKTGQIARGLLLEGFAVSVIASVLAIGITTIGVGILRSIPPDILPRAYAIETGLPVIVVAAVTTAVVGCLLGVMPLLRLRHHNTSDALRGMGRGESAATPAVTLRRMLVVGQIAMAVVLMTGSGLLLRSFNELRAVDPGFDPENRIAVRLTLPPSDYATADNLALTFQKMVDGVRAIPGVISAAAGSDLPLRDWRIYHTYRFEGSEFENGEVAPSYLTKTVTDGYFETMGIQMVDGRGINRSDHENQTDAVVISKTLADQYWPGERAVGRRVRRSVNEPWSTVVGVVEGVRDRRLDDVAQPLVYFPLIGQLGDRGVVRRSMSIVLHSSLSMESLNAAIRDAVWGVDPRVALYDISDYNRVMAGVTRPVRLTMGVLLVAATSALIIGIIGLYGMVSYAVTLRKKEIGIRMALGATHLGVRRMIARQGVVLAAIGVTLGVSASLGVWQSLGSLLYGVAAQDPMTYTAVAFLLIVVSWVASDRPTKALVRSDVRTTLLDD